MHSGLRCTLYPFQRRALSWMCWRETGQLGQHMQLHRAQLQTRMQGAPASGDEAGAGVESAGDDQGGDVHGGAAADPGAAGPEAAGPEAGLGIGTSAAAVVPPAYTEDRISRLLYYQTSITEHMQPVAVGHLSHHEHHHRPQQVYADFTTSQALKAPPAPLPQLRGGLLADEMGLGKTVECIALILQRMDDSTQRGVSSPEGRLQGPTLIVTPPSLLQQWHSELTEHAPVLKVEVYDGLAAMRKDVGHSKRGAGGGRDGRGGDG